MTRTPEGASETGVPEMVIAGPFTFSVWLPTVMALGLAVMSWPFSVIVGGSAGALGTARPVPPAREITSPATVAGSPPAVCVTPLTTMAEGSRTVTA